MLKKVNKWEEEIKNDPCEEIMQEFALFPNPEKAVRDYVKKLMGRLVFLQFLQKKGWLGVPAGAEWGSGDPEFIQNLFTQTTDKDHFIDNVLEVLFNDLNTERKDDNSQLSISNYQLKVPYLNGGLFERDATDETNFPLPSKYMQSMLDFFASYNFTIDENDPDDAEVGVDPEMLGRIFENLLEDNKDKGAFYTPKEIVSYMCRESLIAYLQTDIEDEVTKEAIRQFVTTHDINALGTNDKFCEQVDEALKNVKICDPAIGSGAFPMGLLKELFLCRTALEGIEQSKAAEIKKHIIQQNIYGVDIERGAVDIARLRFWLSLIVDEETPQALPNLDFKIMQGNSLLEQYKGVDLSNITELKQDKVGAYQTTMFDDMLDVLRLDLRKKLDEYYNCTDHKRKAILKQDIINNVKQQLKKQSINVDFGDLDLSGNSQFFLWHTWFYDVFSQGGFDIVIGNPPYVKEYTNRHAFDGFRETSPYYLGKMDLWYGFACHSIDFLSIGGILCFIAQNNWTTSAGAKKMRNKVLADCQIKQLLDFNTYMVFEDADIQTMIMLLERNKNTDNYSFDHRLITKNNEKEDMLALLVKQARNTKYSTPTIACQSFIDKLLTFSDNDSLFGKIVKGKTYLQNDEVAQGIVFPQDFLDKKGAQKLGNKYPVKTGIFGLSQSEKNTLRVNNKEAELIRPYFTTEQIHRYYTDPNNTQWLIYTDSSFKDPQKMKDYPNIKSHLDRFKDIITSDNRPYGLHRCRKQFFFQGEKVISLRKCVERPCFSYSDFDCYVTQTFFCIKTSRWNIKFLTGVLNSTLVAFWLRNKGKMQGNNYQVDKEPLQNIPLPIVEPSAQQLIIGLVDEILKTKSTNFSADTSALESEIDRLVYQLYSLTEEEIKIVEGKD